MQLRDYQNRDVSRIRAAMARTKRVCYTLPTGGGKTVMFAYIAHHAALKGKRILVLVHREELLDQVCAALANTPHGVIKAGRAADARHPVQIASVQTLVNRDTASPELIVIDECHHATAMTWQSILDRFPAAHVLGVTATPVRMGSGLGLGDVFDTLVCGPSVRELTDAGYLAPCKVYAPATVDTTGWRKRGGDYQRKDLETAMNNNAVIGDAVEHYKLFADGQPAIAFCVSVSHAEHVADEFSRAGYRAAHVDGSTPSDIRRARIYGLGKTLDVLTSCDLISEGVDVPIVSAGIGLRPTASLALFKQQIGRILRPGKPEAVYLDHVGNCLRHNILPDTDIEWELKRGSKPRPKAPAVRQCPECYFTHTPAPICPACGHEYAPTPREIQEQEGRLEELRRVEKRKEIGRARTWAELESIRKHRGYKPGWTFMRYAARHGKRAAMQMKETRDE